MLRAAVLLVSLPWGAQGAACANVSTALGHPGPLPGGRYLSIGDGSVVEFEFPEKSEGIIVISSQYPGQGNWAGPSPVLSVTSLDTEVLTIKNVSAITWGGGGGGFVVSIYSGLSGQAPLHIQLMDPRQTPPVLIEERRDFCIKVLPAEDAPAILGADQVHFSASAGPAGAGAGAELGGCRQVRASGRKGRADSGLWPRPGSVFARAGGQARCGRAAARCW